MTPKRAFIGLRIAFSEDARQQRPRFPWLLGLFYPVLSLLLPVRLLLLSLCLPVPCLSLPVLSLLLRVPLPVLSPSSSLLLFCEAETLSFV